MGHVIVENLVGQVSFIHGGFFEGIEDLDEASFRARPGAKAPSIAFHLWHTARWADALQERFGSFAPQLARANADLGVAGACPCLGPRRLARQGGDGDGTRRRRLGCAPAPR